METNNMTKKELIESIMDSIENLKKYDPEFYIQFPKKFYNSKKREKLIDINIEMKRRLGMAAQVKRLGGQITTRRLAVEMQLKNVVKSGVLCELVGLDFVKIKNASERDIKLYYNIIS